MLVTRKSMISGKLRTKEMPVTQEQLDRWSNGELIQNVFPELSLADREFLMTGIDDEEWSQFVEEEDEAV